MSCMGKNTTKVHNIKVYLMATLLNAGSTIGSYYKDMVFNKEYWICSYCKKIFVDAEGKTETSVEKITIADSALKGNKSITKVTITKNVTTIGKKAFKNNEKLTKITIGKNVVYIGSKAFYGCKKLKSITSKTTKLTSKKVGEQTFKEINTKATIKVPKSKLKAYRKMLKSKGVGSKEKIKR